MQYSDIVVTKIPLDSIWLDEGGISAKRIRYLNQEAVRDIIAQHPIVFVVADIGEKLEVIAAAQCYSFWKSEVKHHLADPSVTIHLDHYLGGYAYLASEWVRTNSARLILLEKLH